jgi:hypothetical protein
MELGGGSGGDPTALRVLDEAGTVIFKASNANGIETATGVISNYSGGLDFNTASAGNVRFLTTTGQVVNNGSGGFTNGSGGPRWIRGTGSPEGAVTAVIGSIYSRTDGGASTSIYVKESGTGNTGWVAYGAGGGGGATNLDGLTDVVITSPSDNQFLRHNGTNWVNETVSTGLDESSQAHGALGTTETFSYSTARHHTGTLDSSSCALTFTGWPASGSLGRMEIWINHGTTTAERTITLPAGTRTPYAMALAIPTNIADAEYCLIISTWDGGTTLRAELGGSEFGTPP